MQRTISTSCKVVDKKLFAQEITSPRLYAVYPSVCSLSYAHVSTDVCDCVGVRNPRLDHCDIVCDNAYASYKSPVRTVVPRYSDD